jgi:hypothetical protein
MNPVVEIPVILNLASGAGETTQAVRRVSQLFKSRGRSPKIVIHST